MPKRLLTTKLRPFERHSLVLLVLGGVYVLIGFAYAGLKTPPGRHQVLAAALSIMPMRGWGTVFIVVGVLAILASRWPPAFRETWGYTSLAGLSALWASLYACSMFFMGAPRGTVSAVLLWGGIAFLWWAISGLHNPPRKEI